MTTEFRIAFAGASGTGKTTLATEVASWLGLPGNVVGSRLVAREMGFASPYDVDRAGKRAEFQRRLLEQKTMWEQAHAAFVTDRTTLDNLAYTALHDVDSITDSIFALSTGAVLRYTHVFYCPMAAFHHLGGDPQRKQGANYHRLFESLLSSLLLEFVPPGRLYTVPHHSRQLRSHFVASVLGVELVE